MNLVGLTTQQRSILDLDGSWLEAIAPHRLVSANLYDAQLQRRLDEEKEESGSALIIVAPEKNWRLITPAL